MKNSPLTSVLLGALVVSVLTSVVLCWSYITKARELRGLQGQMQAQIAGIQNNRTFIANLAGDLLEYSKTHPNIDPLLESAGIKQGKSTLGAGAATNKPAAK